MISGLQKSVPIPQSYTYDKSCLFCGAAVIPRLYPSGRTRNLDHFIPVRVLTALNRRFPKHHFDTPLLPACGKCNNFAGEYLFCSVKDKVDFVQFRTERVWSGDPPSALLEIILSDHVRATLKAHAPLSSYDVVWAMVRDPVGWHRVERFISACSLPTPFMASSKTAC
jgi:hypothetical protein